MVDEAIAILNRHGAVDINQRADYYKQTGYTGYNASAQPYTTSELTAERERIRTASIAAAPVAAPALHETRTTTNINTTPAVDTNINRNVQGEQVLNVVEESLAVGKREVQSGGVRVYTRTTEKPGRGERESARRACHRGASRREPPGRCE